MCGDRVAPLDDVVRATDETDKLIRRRSRWRAPAGACVTAGAFAHRRSRTVAAGKKISPKANEPGVPPFPPSCGGDSRFRAAAVPAKVPCSLLKTSTA